MIIDSGSKEVSSSTKTRPGDNSATCIVPGNIGKEEVTHITVAATNDNVKVSGTLNSDQNPFAMNDKVSCALNSDQNPSVTNKNIKELIG